MSSPSNPLISGNENWAGARTPSPTTTKLPDVALQDLYLHAASTPWVRCARVLLLASVLLRLIALSNVVLIPEEAYYWMYARHLSWGYFDHPPMVAWNIRIGTTLFGNTEFGVRFVAGLLLIGSSLLTYRFARLWYGRPTALVSALMLQILPGFCGIGFIATMDSALLFYWLLGVLGAALALRRDRNLGWYLWGIGVGAATLSKYTGVFVGLGALLAVSLHAPWRKHFRSPHPYLAAALAAAMFSPVVVWNATHDWASFRFQLVDRFQGQSFELRHLGAFALFQLLILTPIPLALLLSRAARGVRRRKRLLASPRAVFLLSFAAPLFLLLAYKSLRYSIHFSWTMPAVATLLPFATHAALAGIRQRHGRQRTLWTRELACTVLICLAVNVVGALYLLVLQPRVGWIKAFGPWREVASLVQQRVEELEKQTGREPLVVGGGKYRLASVLAFYREPIEPDVDSSKVTTSRWVIGGSGIGFEYWLDRSRWAGRDCVYVSEQRQLAPRIAAHFDAVTSLTRERFGPREFLVAYCRGLHPRVDKPGRTRVVDFDDDDD